MDLYTLLKDRASINILKILYDTELDNKYTLKYSELQSRLLVPENSSSVSNLKEAGLISVDFQASQPDSMVLSITKKGKLFFEQFDKLKRSLDEKKDSKKAFRIDYSLTEIEQRILVIAHKIILESGKPITMTALTQEVFPYHSPASKRSLVSKHVKRLVQLNLLEKVSQGNKSLIDISRSGKRVIRDQFMEVKI